QTFKLILPVPIGEIGEHEKRQPVINRLIKGAENTRVIGTAGMAHQKVFGLLPTIAPEIGMEEIDHCPEMPPLLDIDLKKIPQIKERGAGLAQQPLLLDGGRLGISLRHD